MTSQKLTVILGLLKGAKARTHTNVSALHHQSTKAPLYAGQTRTYQPRDDDGETRHPESQQVQLRAEDVLKDLREQLSRTWDLALWRDEGNTRARADVVVDGVTLLSQVPATFLLFLEKQLNDWRTAVVKLPYLDPAETWTPDPTTGLHRAQPVVTASSRKVMRNHTIHPGNDKHAPQVQTYTEDVPVGDWTTVKLSGALPVTRQADLVDRLDKLADAVKTAREQANLTEVDEVRAAATLFDYLLN